MRGKPCPVVGVRLNKLGDTEILAHCEAQQVVRETDDALQKRSADRRKLDRHYIPARCRSAATPLLLSAGSLGLQRAQEQLLGEPQTQNVGFSSLWLLEVRSQSKEDCLCRPIVKSTFWSCFTRT